MLLGEVSEQFVTETCVARTDICATEQVLHGGSKLRIILFCDVTGELMCINYCGGVADDLEGCKENNSRNMFTDRKQSTNRDI